MVVSRRLVGRMCGWACVCVYVWVCVARGLLRQAKSWRMTHSRQEHTAGQPRGEQACGSRERESDVILKAMRAGAGIPEVDY